MRTISIDPFELYEPRPNYRRAVRVTAENILDIANYIGANRDEDDPVALVDHYGRNLVLQTVDGEQTTTIGVAYLGDYIVETSSETYLGPAGWCVVKADAFQPRWRKCVGDQN